MKKIEILLFCLLLPLYLLEHLSMYFRSLNFRSDFTNKEAAYHRCMKVLNNYIQRVFSSNSPFVQQSLVEQLLLLYVNPYMST